MQTGSKWSCEMVQDSIEDEDGEGEGITDAAVDKENVEPIAEKAPAPKRQRKLISKVLNNFALNTKWYIC